MRFHLPFARVAVVLLTGWVVTVQIRVVRSGKETGNLALKPELRAEAKRVSRAVVPSASLTLRTSHLRRTMKLCFVKSP